MVFLPKKFLKLMNSGSELPCSLSTGCLVDGGSALLRYRVVKKWNLRNQTTAANPWSCASRIFEDQTEVDFPRCAHGNQTYGLPLFFLNGNQTRRRRKKEVQVQELRGEKHQDGCCIQLAMTSSNSCPVCYASGAVSSIRCQPVQT